MPWLATTGPAIDPPIVLLGFGLLSLAVGRRLLIVMGAGSEGTLLERGVVAAGLGSGFLQFVPFVLGVAGALGTRSLRVAIGIVALAASRDLQAVASAGWRSIRQASRPNPWVAAWALALLPVLVTGVLLALVPTTDPDGLAYHLTVPKRWLQSGRLDYLPTYSLSNTPMGVEMLFSVAMAFAGDVAAKGVHCGLAILGALGLCLAGKRLAGVRLGAVAATLYLIGPAGIHAILGSAYVEGAVTAAMASASLAWVLWLQTRNAGCLRCAAALAGTAVSFKLTAALFPAALFALTWVVVADPARGLGSWRERSLHGLAFVAGFVPFVAAPVLPWMGRAALLTGNPVFPLFARLIPSRDLSPDLSAQFERYSRYMLWGTGLGRQLTFEKRSLLLVLACVGVALLGAVVVVRLRSWQARGLAAVLTVVVLVQLSMVGFYVRYWIPTAAVLMVPLGLVLRSVDLNSIVRAACVAVTLVASLVRSHRCIASEGASVAELVRVATGFEDRRAYLVRHMPPYSLFEDLNQGLPASSRILLSYHCNGFYIDRATFCAEMPQTSLRFSTWIEFASDFRRLGITHVLAPSALGSGGPTPPPELASAGTIIHDAEMTAVRRLVTNYGRVEMGASDQALYEVRGVEPERVDSVLAKDR